MFLDLCELFPSSRFVCAVGEAFLKVQVHAETSDFFENDSM